jgi:predicted 3-demethylubiquinone-9 3-methyltransferase (glyoxalase superfamily)
MCGWLKDRYGLRRQIVPVALTAMLTHRARETARRAMEAMMRMVKRDVAKLQAAFDGNA